MAKVFYINFAYDGKYRLKGDPGWNGICAEKSSRGYYREAGNYKDAVQQMVNDLHDGICHISDNEWEWARVEYGTGQVTTDDSTAMPKFFCVVGRKVTWQRAAQRREEQRLEAMIRKG
jgi:hypothetical protein